jgi:ATP-binding cassette subfamily B protein
MEKFNTQRLRNLKKAVVLVYKSAPFFTLTNLALSVVQGLLPLLSLVLMKQLVDTVALNLSTAPVYRSAWPAVFFVCCLGIVSLIQTVCRSLSEVVSEAQSQAVTDHVSEILHAKSIEVDLEYYENPQYYDTLHRAQREAFFRPLNIVNSLASLATNIFTLCALSALVFSFHWSVAIILIIAAVPGFIVRLKYSSRLYHWHYQSTSRERHANYFNWLLTSKSHAKEIRLFNLGNLFARRFADLRQKLRLEKLRLTVRRSFAEGVSGIVTTVVLFLPLAFIVFRCVRGAITLGSMVMYYQALQRGLSCLSNAMSSIASFYDNSLFISDFYDFLSLEKKVCEPKEPKSFPNPVQRGITFEQVDFSYPNSSNKVISNVNFTIRPGEHIALVGDNGAGKTTLIKLLCRLYDPSSGRITIDGTDLKEFSTKALRSHLSTIFQDYAQYNMTARENIWFGDITTNPKGGQIERAAQFSGADDFLNKLPRGYETLLGKLFEEGQELSIGQWQKLALARAFMRQSQILILDEPTSNLDARTEFEVFKRFHELAAGRTVFFISHRFSTVRMANRIFILRDGKIIESGSHQELVEAGGVYAELFAMQAQHYR